MCLNRHKKILPRAQCILRRCATTQERASTEGAPLTAAKLMAGFSGPVQKDIGKALDFPFNMAVSTHNICRRSLNSYCTLCGVQCILDVVEVNP